MSRRCVKSNIAGPTRYAAAFLAGIEEGVPAIPADEIFEVARVTIEAAELLRKQ